MQDLENDLKPNETPGMDASVVKINNIPNVELYMISTTDFFYPLVDSPYMQGKIACANVLSDMYAMGVVEIDTMLMILGVCRDMTSRERDVVTTDMIRGFNDLARAAGTNVTGGQTVMNPWPIVGGVATATRLSSQFIRPESAIPGDVLILTKALGTQIVVNLWEWMRDDVRWKRISSVVDRDIVKNAYRQSTEMMIRLNRTGAMLMHKYDAHSATDVTGFGILGHLRNMVKSQLANVDFELHTLPIIKHMAAVDDACDKMFKLVEGYSAETSGGLLLALPECNAQKFLDDMLEIDGESAWVVGKVVNGSKQARISPNVKILEV